MLRRMYLLWLSTNLLTLGIARERSDVPVTVRLLLLTAKAIEVEADLSAVRTRKPAKMEVELWQRQAHNVVRSQTVPCDDERAIAWLSTDGLSAGDYRLLVRIVDAVGNEIASVWRNVHIVPIPEWWRNAHGLEETVPPPWTPIKVRKVKKHGILPTYVVSVWGRTFKFDGSPLPTSIMNQGDEMLVAPMRFDVAIYGDRFAFFPMRQWHGVRAKTIALKLLKASDAQVILWGRALYNDVEIDVRTTVEFDGCVRCDVRVNPNTHYVTKFALVVPLQRRWVKFVYHWPPGFPHIDNAFPLPSSGWQSSFRHYVWLGRDDGGIAWFTESEQPFVKGRASSDEHRVIEALVLDNAVELRINFVRHATMPTFREWTVTFGIMPTPVKPWRGDYHSRFVGIDAIYGMERAMFSVGSTISYPASDINIARGTIEMWLRMCFDTLHNDAFIMRPVRPYMPTEMFLEWRSKLAGNMGAGLRLRVMEQRRKELLCMRVPLKWRRGEWHHLALTWGDAIRIYADGKLMAERKFTGLFGGRPGWDRYGSLLLGGSAVTIDVDELRISQIARTQFELMKPPVVDAHTLLLDRMECRDERTPIRRTKVEMGQGGLLSELAQFCDGKFGGALRLYGRKYDHTTFEHFARLGIHAVNLPEWWTHAQGTTETTHEQRLKRFVQEAHKHRIKVLLYFGFEMSDAANEWRWLKHELAGIKPKARTQLRIRSLSPPQTYFAIDHGAQPYQDYLIGGIVHLMRKYDIDGVYLDGTHLAGGCANPYHGHRWYDERGNVHTTSYIWSSRRLMKRLYRIMKAFKRDSVIFAHTSSALLAPTLSFADYFYNGEQLNVIVLRERKDGYKPPVAIVPLATFRVLFSGRALGVRCYWHRGKFTLDEALSLSLLHDTFPAPYLPDGATTEAIGRIWRIYRDFDADGAEWHPYFEKPPLLRCEPGVVKASAHWHRRNGSMLIVVSNLSAKRITARVSLHERIRKRYRVRMIRAVDCITGNTVPLANGTLITSVNGASFRLLKVRVQ